MCYYLFYSSAYFACSKKAFKYKHLYRTARFSECFNWSLNREITDLSIVRKWMNETVKYKTKTLKG